MTGAADREAIPAALARALPYVRLYKHKAFVVKLGGALSADPAVLRRTAEQVSILVELGMRVVVVHGGGPQLNGLSARLGLAVNQVEGRRVTDPATLEAAVMTLNGTVNTAILAACRAEGLQAVGVSGVDGGLIKARVRPPVTVGAGREATTVNFGEVGDVEAVDAGVLNRLLDAGFVPVVSCLAADETGRVLNVNADTVAAEVARALGAEKLIFLTETPGLLEDRNDPASLLSVLDLDCLVGLEVRGVVDGGMLPKLAAARRALESGVKRVHLVGGRQPGSLLIEIFTNEGSGTLLVRSLAELGASEGSGAAPDPAVESGA